jgi:phenylalanine-4-hydroxylase
VDISGYENQQIYESLTLQDHLSWACLVSDQQATKHQYACREYLLGEEMFEIGGNVIPDYYVLNARIYQQTGWQLATVSEIIPAEVFFHCHSRKFFPVTTFMRPLGTDYLQEPDVGHDVAGHVATFTIPQVAQVMENHGLANDLIRREADEKLVSAKSEVERLQINADAKELLLYAGRMYWFTVEFGLVLQQGQLRAFGAGILSSPGETRYSVESPRSNRILIDPADDRDLLRLATTDYLISEFQKTYFVMKDFESLTSLTPERILRIVRIATRLPHHTWREIAPGDDVMNVGLAVASPNEKYYRLIANQPLDECLRRTAIRNLRLCAKGLELHEDEEYEFVKKLPNVPEKLIQEFAIADRLSDIYSIEATTPVLT